MSRPETAIQIAWRFEANLNRDLRRALLRRFPFALYFIASDVDVIVWALLHQRRARTVLDKRI
jgi:hypothetical protein